MFTGYKPSPAIKFPSFGSVVSHEFGSRKNLPPYVCVPNVPNEYASSGYLSSSYGPLDLAQTQQGRFQGPRPFLPKDMTGDRFSKRRSLLDTVDDHFRIPKTLMPWCHG